MITLEPGMTVVCVRADDTNQFGLEELFLGSRYTIAWIGVFTDGPGFHVHVAEIDRRPCLSRVTGQIEFVPVKVMEEVWGLGAGSFLADRFRPIHEDAVGKIRDAALPREKEKA